MLTNKMTDLCAESLKKLPNQSTSSCPVFTKRHHNLEPLKQFIRLTVTNFPMERMSKYNNKNDIFLCNNIYGKKYLVSFF